MELRHLEHFIAVAEQKHFTRAAEAMSISQSGLSASIRALERELHASLFVRNTRSVELTEAGRALLCEGRRTLAAAEAARDAVAAVQGLVRGHLTVGLEQCLGVVDVPALLAKFRSAYPGVEIEVRQAGSTPMLDELASGRLDVAFVATSGHPVDGLDLRPLSTESMVLVCAPDHRLSGAPEVSLQDLAGESFVDFDRTWGARAISDHAFAAANVAHPVTIEVNDVHTLLALVAHDLGVALVPERIAAKRGDHKTVPLTPGAASAWQVSVAVPTSPAASLTADALIGMLPTTRT
ncbi:LysR family transcriptional regulator [Kribbella italica]|uniref:DNA-binding transcriptional LysR family regulator n=1 Tax=Kribbella italica TaxID=1540520 RepID=A0A7W9J656_9ACTN|nr:LysR family transcriptional regulator [Kribbella italica]MBB5836331.1 DNA-binding transcriptional LysR family regulator [Kribbella italica]